MSVRMSSEVWGLQVKSNRKLVLLALADYANDEGASMYPTIDSLVNRTGVARRTVMRILKELREAGALVCYEYKPTQHGGKIPVYRFVISKLRALKDDVEGATAAPPDNVDNLSEGATAAPPEGAKTNISECQNEHLRVPDRTPEGAKTAFQSAKTNVSECHSLALNPSLTINRKDTRDSGDDLAAADEPKPLPANSHWKRCEQHLIDRLGDEAWNVYVCKLEVLADDGAVIKLMVATAFYKNWIEQNYLAIMADVLNRKIEFVIGTWQSLAMSKRATERVESRREGRRAH